MSTSALVIEGTPRPRILASMRELLTYRGTVAAFAERSIRVKYKQTLLGVAWAVIQPLTYMLVFSLALGRGANVPGDGAPYAAFALSALVAWMFVQTGVSFGAAALVSDAAVIRKVYFPREVPVLGAMAGSAIDFAIGLGLFAILGPVLGANVSPWWLLTPVLGLLLGLLATGVTLVLAALNVYYRDVRFALPFLLQLWLFASPVAYPLAVVPDGWRLAMVIANPAAGLLDGFRATLAVGQAPDMGLLALGAAGALVWFLAGYRIFKGLEPNFADIV